jgi:hypothetical protein
MKLVNHFLLLGDDYKFIHIDDQVSDHPGHERDPMVKIVLITSKPHMNPIREFFHFTYIFHPVQDIEKLIHSVIS